MRWGCKWTVWPATPHFSRYLRSRLKAGGGNGILFGQITGPNKMDPFKQTSSGVPYHFLFPSKYSVSHEFKNWITLPIEASLGVPSKFTGSNNMHWSGFASQKLQFIVDLWGICIPKVLSTKACDVYQTCHLKYVAFKWIGCFWIENYVRRYK